MTSEHQILQFMQKEISNAQHTADTARNDISAHEKLCVLRYDNIIQSQQSFQEHLSGIVDRSIPRLFTKIDKLGTLVNIGIGLLLAIPLIFGFCYALYKFVKG